MARKKEKLLCPICKKDWASSNEWCPNCYYDFCREHKVWGQAAIKLKKELDKQVIPIPKVKQLGLELGG